MDNKSPKSKREKGNNVYLCCVKVENSHYMADIIIPNTSDLLPDGYEAWRNAIETRIERAKLQAALKVNSELLSLYWSIRNDILEKQQKLGWGRK